MEQLQLPDVTFQTGWNGPLFPERSARIINGSWLRDSRLIGPLDYEKRNATCPVALSFVSFVFVNQALPSSSYLTFIYIRGQVMRDQETHTKN